MLLQKGEFMKTATITYHNVYNYGALLQAYALQQAQLKLSLDNEIIDFSYDKNRMYTLTEGRSIKIWIVNILRLLESLRDYFSIRRRCKRFEEFTKKKLRLTSKYLSLEELKANPPKADIYITGGDQLWNITSPIKRAFFLDFGKKETKRASFAVSMGSCELPNHLRKEIYALLNNISHISVREAKAKADLEELLDKKDFVQVHLDPVFLLSRDEWIDFAAFRGIKDKYILCYPMSGNPQLMKGLKKLKKLTNYKIVVLSSEVFARVKGDYYIKDASVEEFVYLISHAEYVMTTSFHGTAFSILFNKNFYSFIGDKERRITWLLKKLGLENRMIGNINAITLEDIDYGNVNEIIEKERKAAYRYLMDITK